MSNEFDLIIIGGGCAGLSLASHLSRYGEAAPRTLVLDGLTEYRNDRTWCFWQLPGTEGVDLVEHQWQRFRVGGKEASVNVDCADHPYCAIPADRFYRHALNTIEESAQVSFQGGSPVIGRIRRSGARWEVETPQGSFSARSVVDTRPTGAPRVGGALLWQSFLGVEIESVKECFPAKEMTLMDFGRSPEHRMVFTYVLPFSSTRALVEVTEFSPTPLQATDLQALLTEALKEISQGGQYRRLRTEAGILPMGQAALPTDAEGSSYVRAGVASGAARACTGYAFQRIQRWASQCALTVVEDGHPIGQPKDSRSLAFLDQLFLRVLRENPNLAPSFFTQLFSAASTGSVLRFLGDRPTVMDVLRVVNALPPRPFLKALVDVCKEPALAWRESLVS